MGAFRPFIYRKRRRATTALRRCFAVAPPRNDSMGVFRLGITVMGTVSEQVDDPPGFPVCDN